MWTPSSLKDHNLSPIAKSSGTTAHSWCTVVTVKNFSIGFITFRKAS